MAGKRKFLFRSVCLALFGMAMLAEPTFAIARNGMQSLVTPVQWRPDERFESEGTPIDGIWILSSDGTRIDIHGDRSWNDRTGKPMSRGIHETRPGNYVLHDLICNCRAKMNLTLDGTLLGVSHTITGPVRWSLHPVSLEHPGWFRQDEHRVSEDNEDDDDN